MKIRSLRPEFFADGRMAQLSPMARILYMGLWCIADDEGRGRFHPKSIEGEVFPHETVDIRTLLTELIEMGRIVTYDVGAESYFHIPKFTTYQHPNRAFESRLPPPPDTALAARAQCVDSASAPPVVVEVVVEEAVVVEGGEAPAVRARNRVWDAFAEIFGEPSNEKLQNRRGGNVNPVIASLVNEWGLKPSEVRTSDQAFIEVMQRAQRWPLHYDDATFTEESLMKHWDTLAREPLRASKHKVKQLSRATQRFQRDRELEEMSP